MAPDISRRDFLKTTSATAGVTAAAVSPLSSVFASEEDLSKVVIAKDTECIIDDNGNVNEEKIQDMVDHAIIELTGINNTSKAYEALFPEPVTTSTTIAIKENGISGKTSKSYQVVLNALKRGLTTMLDGTFPEKKITITIGRGSISATNPSFLIDNKYKYTIQDIWVQSDWIIDAPVCWANTPPFGVTLSLKNMMSTVGGTSLSNMCTKAQDPWMQILNSQPLYKEKRVLTIIDAIMGRSKSGPGGECDYEAHKVIVSKDTLAADYCGIQILSEFNLSSSLEKTGLEHLALAANSPYNIGTDKPDMMDIVEIKPPWDPTEIKSVGNSHRIDSQVKVVTNSAGSQVTFKLSKFEENHAELSIFDMQGRQVWVYKGIGNNNIVWNRKDLNGKRVSQGTYVYNLKVGVHTINGKVPIKWENPHF